MKKVLFIALITSLFILSSCQSGNECETKFSEYIPDTITLKKSGEESSFWKHIEDFKWLDGTEVSNLDVIYYQSGREKGENVNYFYAEDDDSFAKKQLGYSKQSLSEDGVILGDNTFEINFVLEPLPETKKDETTSVVGSSIVLNSTQNFRVMEVRFSSCKLYE